MNNGRPRRQSRRRGGHAPERAGRRAEQSTFWTLLVLGVAFTGVLILQLLKIGAENGIPDRYVDEWARARADELVEAGCVYVDVDAQPAWVAISETADCVAELDTRNALRQRVERLYRQDSAFYRSLRSQIASNRQHSLREGSPPSPFRPERDSHGGGIWRVRPGSDATTRAEIESVLPELRRYSFNDRFRLRDDKQPNDPDLRRLLEGWLRKRDIVAQLRFDNPFVVTDPAVLTRRLRSRPGFIFDRNGRPLAYNEPGPATEPVRRVHSGGPAFTSLIGRRNPGEIGFGLERDLRILLDPEREGLRVCDLEAEEDGRPQRGCDVVLSVDAALTEAVYSAFAQATAAVDPAEPPGLERFRSAWAASEDAELVAVFIDVATGEIRASTQFPAGDPTDAETLTDADKRHHPRQDHIFPGSSFKAVISLAGLSAGTLETGAANLRNTTDRWQASSCAAPVRGRAGRIGFERAFVTSRNQYFARLGVEIDGDGERLPTRLAELLSFDEFQLGAWSDERYLGKVSVARNGLEVDGRCRPNAMSQAGFGGGVVRVSPTYMAWVATLIAAGGRLPQFPMLVTDAGRLDGAEPASASEAHGVWAGGSFTSAYPFASPQTRAFVAPEAAAELRSLMCRVSDVGTAARFLSPTRAGFPIRVGAKTGTHEYSEASGDNLHDMSVLGFYPAEAPRIAFFVGVRKIRPDRSGSFVSTDVIVPVAAEVIRSTLGPLGLETPDPLPPCPRRPHAG